jgi:hypothetical protein
MKLLRAVVFSLSTAVLAVPAFGQIHVYIGAPPPPVRIEVRPPMPGDGFIWVDGYWGNDGYRYRWVRGHWDRPPYGDGYWTGPHYVREHDGWRMEQGHWDHRDHGDHRDWGHDHRDDHHDDHHDHHDDHHDDHR